MFRRILLPLGHECRRLLGMALSRIRLHRVEFISRAGTDVVRKRRRYFAHLIRPVGNAFLRLNGSSIVVLATRQWLDWERAIENSTCRELVLCASPDITDTGSSLFCRRIPGVSLRQVLTDTAYSPGGKSDAIRWSLEAIRILHQNDADWGQGIRQSISHGDATVNNVIVDFDTSSACWIDFDTRHRPNLTQADRRTDDLRSLIYSTAAHLPASSFPQLAEILIAGADDTLIEHFLQRLKNEWVHLTTFQLAQAPLRWSAMKALRAALLQSMLFE